MPTREYLYGHKKAFIDQDSLENANPLKSLLFRNNQAKERTQVEDTKTYFYLKDFPSHLKNKIKILISVSKKLGIKNWEEMKTQYKESCELRKSNKPAEQIFDEHFKANPDCLNMITLSKVIFGKNFSIIFLSNGNFQIIFSDQLEIFYCKDSETIFITKDSEYELSYPLGNLILIDNISLWNRISFVNEILKKIQIGQFDKDTSRYPDVNKKVST